MQKLISLALSIIVIYTSAAQTQPTCNPYPKTISVSGSAEMEVVPDEIYVLITLREYKKRGEEKIEIDKIKTDFLTKCSSIGLPDSAISIASFQGSNYNYWYMQRKRKKDPDMFATISYQLKFNTSKKIDQLVDVLDDEATAGFQIVKTTHSKIQEYRKQLKLQAVKAAKEKAAYLTEAINEKLGEAITVEEPQELDYSDNRNRASNMSSNTLSYSKDLYKEELKMDDAGHQIDFKKVKLRFVVSIVFAIK
jgi:uncharacterized protein